eukprot:Protomagalhaensia_sp_Gyna_25__5810@NODE_858_length_2506_cov_66_028780_g678_i0_p1_GENE_NODE_858_length_2506_cov_66_028780_g678_i0NODE_858_length_2506_cov_66_028780_g678_i0_p1_ORF_typecomplete_len514_score82_09Choline_kinase/PF01633_20/9_7e44APH/PF01636_23/3_3e13EcKinase/PF02958_20/1_7e06WaaY/PF06176_11/4_2e05Kdo/PF06293_14/1_6e02Kdo/PF06293_14/0_0059DUF1679/PF07914_11/0_00073Pkinase_fungal/PF17667_1/0_0038RIO1/PF01163_22/0_0061Pkinase/PF00069_25/0_099_NODE_858_length_2506_cov_66_028780_g678_i0901
MPELPYTALVARSQSSGNSSPAVSCTAADFVVMGRSNSRVSGSVSIPSESPTMSSLVRVLQDRFPAASKKESPTKTDDEDQSQISSAAHGLHPVKKLEDIIESGREFSNLTDPATIRQLCLAKVPGWRMGVEEDQILVSQIMAGLTNQLFRVELDNRLKDTITPSCVLFRVYGATVGDLYDPVFELQVFKVLAQHDSAPRHIADFIGGRIEEYILGPALLCQDMCKPPVLCAMATIMGRFHKLDQVVPEIAAWRQREAQCWKSLRQWTAKSLSLYELARLTTETVPKFEISRQQSMESVASTEDVFRDKAMRMNTSARLSFLQRLRNTGIDEMAKESKNLKEIVLKDAPPSPVLNIGFCHNDVQENNILVTGTRLRLIDFEYANFNHLAFDIANFLCEATIDYCVPVFPFYEHKIGVKEFPSEEIVRMLASVYLSEYTGETVLPSNEEWLKPFVINVYRFVLVSHMVWGFWSLIRAPQAATACDFDFLLYAKSRFDAYRIWKQHLLDIGYLDA